MKKIHVFILLSLLSTGAIAQLPHLIKDCPWAYKQSYTPAERLRHEIFSEFMALPENLDEALLKSAGVKSVRLLPDSSYFEFDRNGHLVLWKTKDNSGQFYPREYRYDEDGRLIWYEKTSWFEAFDKLQESKSTAKFQYLGSGSPPATEFVTLKIDFRHDGTPVTDYHKVDWHIDSGQPSYYVESTKAQLIDQDMKFARWVNKPYSPKTLEQFMSSSTSGIVRFYDHDGNLDFYCYQSAYGQRVNVDYWRKNHPDGGFSQCYQGWQGQASQPESADYACILFDKEFRMVSHSNFTVSKNGKKESEGPKTMTFAYEKDKVIYTRFDEAGQKDQTITYFFSDKKLPEKVLYETRNEAGEFVPYEVNYDYTFW